MRYSQAITIQTIFFFLFFIFIGANPGLFPDTENDETVISKLLIKAENDYQNGKFIEAIGIYEQIIMKLNKRKELVKTKQKLFKTMVSLALTYFTIQETDKSKLQLEKLIKINPNQEIDEEIYPPGFIKLFRDAQNNILGELIITSSPTEAAVTLDNKSIGVTPLKIKKFVKGKYIITIAKKGYNVSTKEIEVNSNKSNSIEVLLEKVAVKKVIEKEGVKKKKKMSPFILIGGAVVIGAVILLMSKKKKEPELRTLSKQFYNNTPTAIGSYVPAYSIIEVSGITGKIKKIEYAVSINHPKIEDLSVALIGTDNRTVYSVWNKGLHEDNGKNFIGTTEIFNSITPNGNWKVTVNNSGERKHGEITKWSIKIYYVQ